MKKFIWENCALCVPIIRRQVTKDLAKVFKLDYVKIYDHFQVPIKELCNSEKEFDSLLSLIDDLRYYGVISSGDEILFGVLGKHVDDYEELDASDMDNRDKTEYPYDSFYMYGNTRDGMVALKAILIIKIANMLLEEEEDENFYNEILRSILIFKSIGEKCHFVLIGDRGNTIFEYNGPHLFNPMNKQEEIKNTNSEPESKKKFKNKLLKAYILSSFIKSMNQK